MKFKKLLTLSLAATMGITTVPVMAAEQASTTVPTPITMLDLNKDLPSGQEYIVEKELVFDNPFGDSSLKESLNEYGKYDLPESAWTTYEGNPNRQPLWNKGLTVSYWIKVHTDEAGNCLPTSVLRWELKQEMYQSDDYAKHLTAEYFDVLQKAMSEEEKVLALKEESGVLYGSPYYFKYAETDGVDENGAPLSKEITQDGLTGPIYESKYFYGDSETNRAIYYAYNPAFKRGFTKQADGTYEPQLKELVGSNPNYYETYKELDMENGSVVRRADVYGEFQIDMDNSFGWVPDNGEGINKNSNTKGYGEKQAMQAQNAFCMKANGQNKESGNTWHQVTVTLQNDWVEVYVDGKCANVYENYQVVDTSQFGLFNKGTGMRHGIGDADVAGTANLSYGSYVGQLFMDWITNENATLHIGGVGTCAQQLNLSTVANSFSMDDVYFYGELLNAKQIQAAYEEQADARKADQPTEENPPANGEDKPDENNVLAGDVDGNAKIELNDAQSALKAALHIITLREEQKIRADVNNDGNITLKDAQEILKKALKI